MTRSPGAEVRVTDLSGGDRLHIRPVRVTDRAALEDLDHRLSADDHHFRYFSFFRPGRRFFDRLVRINERSGCSLVAELVDPKGTTRLVAEADYELLESGDAELGIAVDPQWRGWLGPYLLDALCDVAAERGVECIFADILWENHAMLALAKERGGTMVGRPDVGVVRYRIPTAGEPTGPAA